MDDGALIRYKNVEIHQQELCVLSDVNLELHKGEVVYLIGKVGSGKTSLLKTLYGELDVIDGEAKVLDYNMRSIKRKHIPQLSTSSIRSLISCLFFQPVARSTNSRLL